MGIRVPLSSLMDYSGDPLVVVTIAALIAIGGINHSNAPEVVQAGADGLCAISCVVAEDDVRCQIRRFQELFGRV